MKCAHYFFIFLIPLYSPTFTCSMAGNQTAFLYERQLFLASNNYGNQTNVRIVVPYFSGEAKPCTPNLLLTILMTLAKLRLGLHTR